MMKAEYKRLGDYIVAVDERNSDLSITLSQGINNNKYFQQPRQVAENSANDKIVRRGYFAYNRATTRNGDKISIAYREGEDCTVSAAYQVFYIKNEELLNPHYLLLWFKRPTFDRYARFKSHGSAHEFFEWDEMCNVMLPVPSIEEQRRIVSQYQTVENRIKNNERLIALLEDTAQTIFRHRFVDNIDTNNLPEGWRMGTVEELCMIKNGKANVAGSGDIPIYGGNGIVGYTDNSNAQDVIIIGRVGINCGSLFLPQGKCYVNDNAMTATPYDGNINFLYALLDSLNLNGQSEGSGQPLLTQSIIYKLECVIPDDSSRKEYETKSSIMNRHISLIEKENLFLTSTKETLINSL